MKRKIIMKLTALAAVMALLFCAPGCSGGSKEEEPVQSSGNQDENGVYYDNGETFCRGVWAADDGESLTGYYIFTDAGSGRFEEIQFGMGVPFQVTAKGNAAEFNLGAADFSDPATVEITGEGKRSLTWTSDNRVEFLTLLGDYEPDSFRFYPVSDLSEKAELFYRNANGKAPQSTSVTVQPDGTAAVEFSTGSGKKRKILTAYLVNCVTGKGFVKDTEEEVDLTAPAAEE